MGASTSRSLTSRDGYTVVPINPDFEPVPPAKAVDPVPVRNVLLKACESESKRGFYEAVQTHEILHYHTNHDQVILRKGAPLIRILFEAYAQHGDVSLTPDDIWQHLLGELGTWVNAQPETYRSVITDAAAGKKLVQVGVSRFPQTTEEWQSLLANFTVKLRQQAQPAVEALLAPTFTTTTPLDSAVNSVLVMNTVKEFFDFRMRISCGLRHLHLGGTVEDWEQLLVAAESLKPFGLTRWVDGQLLPILKQFLRARTGDIDVNWWNRIFRRDAQRVGAKKLGYGFGDEGYKYITGWVLGLSPRFRDVIPEQSKVKLRHFTSSIRTVPLQLDTLGAVREDMQVVGGLLGFTSGARGFELVKGVAVLALLSAPTAA